MRGETILIIDDEKLIRWSLGQELKKDGFNVIEEENLCGAMRTIQINEPDLIILDQRLPDGTGLELLKKLKEENISFPVIFFTTVDSSEIAVKAMKLGAIDYVTKPINMDELRMTINKALESSMLKRQISHFLKEQEKTYGFCGLIGNSAAMKQVFDLITKISQSSSTTVLITGESGTGKELTAKAIHFLSDRKNRPLMTVNCAALPETLIESELFGHEKGAFTDAKFLKKGIFEMAEGGTVFLDEIGDLSLSLQVKLLRALEQKCFRRIGSNTDISVDVRFISATNQSLEHMIQDRTFRSDLFYRLNVARIHLPLLRDRGDDIIILAEYFLHEFNTAFHKHFKGLSKETDVLFRQYAWPGNVRELRNVLERATLLDEGEWLFLHHVELGHLHQLDRVSSQAHAVHETDQSLDEMEKQALLQALEKTSFNQSKAARLLKISRDTLRYRIKKYNIDKADHK